METTETRWCKNCQKRFEVELGKRGASHFKIFCKDACRKAYWQRENRWKKQDNCPSCGGIKEKVSRYCRLCIKPNNPSGFRGNI